MDDSAVLKQQFQQVDEDLISLTVKGIVHHRYQQFIDKVEDITQEVIISILVQIRTNKLKIDDLKSYAARLTINNCLNRIKKGKIRRYVYLDDKEEIIELASKLINQDKILEIKDLYKIALERLTPKQFLVFKLLGCEWAPKEIAQELEMTPNAVRVMIFEIRKLMKDVMDFLQ